MKHENSGIFTTEHFLTAAECDAEGRMPLTTLVERIIESATCHANALGIGYADLIKMDLAWVLSRVSVEIVRMPAINESYVMNTWIESTNRLFSERCFSITSPDGSVFVNARTTWAAICVTSRRAANPGVFGDMMFPQNPPVCPVTPAKRTLPLPADTDSEAYTFRYCDIDFNRHVNTVRYVGLIVDRWSLGWYDTHYVARFDIAFHRECHFGDTVDVRTSTDDGVSLCELIRDGERVVTANIIWREKE